MKLIIYLPAFNEEGNIQQVIHNLPKSIDQVDTIEILVIDDGSSDNTADLALSAGAQVVSLKRNFGVGVAFQTAIQYALDHGADILVGIDADNQFDPEEISPLIAPIINKKADMVIGNRFSSGAPRNMPIIKYWGNKVMTSLINIISRHKFQDVSCGFRAHNRESLLRLNIFADFTYTQESILSLIFQRLKVIEHPVSVRYFSERKSRVAKSLVKYAVQTLKIIIRVVMDYQPFRIFGIISGILLALGLGFELALFIYYIIANQFSPYKSLGFIGLGFFLLGLVVLLFAAIADILNRVRINQNKILYEIKKLKQKNLQQ